MRNKTELSEKQTESTLDLMELNLLAIGVSILSLAAIFIKLSENQLGPNATIFNRLWIANLTLGLWKGIERVRYRTSHDLSVPLKSYTIQDFALFLAGGGFSGLTLLFWAWSLTQTSVANSTLLHNMVPIFATLGGWLFWGHYFDGRFIIGLVLSVGGTIAIGVEDLQLDRSHFVGDAIAFLSAVFYAAYYLIIQQLRGKFPVATVLLWACIIACLLTLPIVLLTEDQLFPYSWEGWVAVIGLGVFCQVIGLGIMAYSLKKFSAGFVSLFLMLEPLMTAIFAGLIFAEKLSILNWVSFFVVLVGIYLAKSGQGAEQVIGD